MTLTDEVLAAMECSNAYCNNAQVVILPSDAAEQYPDAASMSELNFAVESGSAGEDMAIENGFSYTPVTDQATAVLEVSSGTCDAAIIDSLMAAAMVGEGTSYADLTYTISLNSEEYGVGFRKGSDLPPRPSTRSSPRPTPTAPCRSWPRPVRRLRRADRAGVSACFPAQHKVY